MGRLAKGGSGRGTTWVMKEQWWWWCNLESKSRTSRRVHGVHGSVAVIYRSMMVVHGSMMLDRGSVMVGW